MLSWKYRDIKYKYRWAYRYLLFPQIIKVILLCLNTFSGPVNSAFCFAFPISPSPLHTLSGSVCLVVLTLTLRHPTLWSLVQFLDAPPHRETAALLSTFCAQCLSGPAAIAHTGSAAETQLLLRAPPHTSGPSGQSEPRFLVCEMRLRTPSSQSGERA